jgi:hypothetical protein
MFLPSAIVFELSWSLLLASSSVKTFTFMLTGSHSIYHTGNGTVVDDQVITVPEMALGAFVMACSGAAMAAYMWIQYKAKQTRHRGRLIPYTVDAESIPLHLQATDHMEEALMRRAQQETYDAFVVEDPAAEKT